MAVTADTVLYHIVVPHRLGHGELVYARQDCTRRQYLRFVATVWLLVVLVGFCTLISQAFPHQPLVQFCFRQIHSRRSRVPDDLFQVWQKNFGASFRSIVCTYFYTPSRPSSGFGLSCLWQYANIKASRKGLFGMLPNLDVF
jgi:hypothetical protein